MCVFTCLRDGFTFSTIEIVFREWSVGFRQADILQIFSDKGKKKVWFGLSCFSALRSANQILGGQCFQLPTQNLEKRIYQEMQENRLQELVEKQ
jgi:hypothetical protein